MWRAHGLKPHLIRTFKLSNDPRFEEKLRDVVGLYLDRPTTPRSALTESDPGMDRTQPGLPTLRDDDYKRHGTTTLFAASTCLGKTYRKHRHQEVLRFLREDRSQGTRDSHLLDNYSTHKHEKVLAWIERKKRIRFLHFIPTSTSLGQPRGALLRQRRSRFVVVSSRSVPHGGEVLREYSHSHKKTRVLGVDKDSSKKCGDPMFC